MSIHFFETNDHEQRYLTERLPGETLRFRPAPLTTAEQAREIARDAEIISPFVHSQLGADVIENLPYLKMIPTRSTGFDHINVPDAESREIPVCSGRQHQSLSERQAAEPNPYLTREYTEENINGK